MDSQLALEILENYVPIVFATLVESFWVLLNRLLAIVQPFTELQRGHSSSARSVDLKYTSLPPQLLIWKAAKAKHILLGIVCLISILGNALSVSLGGLFNELPVAADEAVQIPVLQTPTVTNSSLGSLIKALDASANGYTDDFTIAKVYLTTGTRLPPWLTEDYYFLPFALDGMLDVGAESYTARTHGVTTLPSCKPLARAVLTRTNINPPQFLEQSTSTGSLGPISAPWLKCVNLTLLAENPFNRTGRIGVDLPLPLETCKTPFYRAEVRAWARSTTDDKSPVIRNMEITGIECQPRLVTAEFDVTVDSTGRVLGASRVGDFGPFSWGPGNATQVRETLERVAFDSPSSLSQQIYWYNSTDNGGTINYLMALRNNTFNDPTTPLPDPDKLVTEVEAISRMLNVALFQQNPTIFEKAIDSTATIQGTRRITVTKIFMANVAFIISMVLLSLSIVTAVVVYVFGPKPFLPRFPDTIGSVLGYVAKSRLTEPDWETTSMASSEDQSNGAEKASKTTYSFGRYTDRDGNEHLGIDADPFVIKVDREGTPEWQGQENATSWLAWFRGRSSRRRESED